MYLVNYNVTSIDIFCDTQSSYPTDLDGIWVPALTDITCEGSCELRCA